MYIRHAVSNFYGTEIEIWAGFGPVGNTKKYLGRSWTTKEFFIIIFVGSN